MGQRISYSCDGVVCSNCGNIIKGQYVQLTKKVRVDMGHHAEEDDGIHDKDTKKLCVDCNKKRLNK